MKKHAGFRAIAAVALVIVGYSLALSSDYTEKQVFVDAGSCHLQMNVIEPSSGAGQNSVVLFHGIAANKKVMWYIADGFAQLGFRVFVPDLPGHGRSAGPFSPARAEECSESLVRGLAARGIIDPQHTLLAGHSLGAAIAVRVASRVRVAGVIAISPAPAKSAHGVWPEMLLFNDSAPLPPNALVLSGAWEPSLMRANAAELLDSRNDGTARYEIVPAATHVSLLFTPQTVRLSQQWAAHLFQLPYPAPASQFPSLHSLYACFLGFAGLLLLSGPFLRELFSGVPVLEKETASITKNLALARIFLEFIGVAAAVVLLLRYWMPFGFLHLFEGDYLACFLCFAGALLLILRRKNLRSAFAGRTQAILLAAFAAFVLHFLVTGWFEITATESWLTPARWLRFPVLFLSAFVFNLALELSLGPASLRTGWRRLALGVAVLAATWLVLAAGVRYLHSGQILLILLSPYFLQLCFWQHLGCGLIRGRSGAAASAVFGAILWAGFCLVLFPLT
jgi:pimeloyl-ACP methyl ester carboxylesterase